MSDSSQQFVAVLLAIGVALSVVALGAGLAAAHQKVDQSTTDETATVQSEIVDGTSIDFNASSDQNETVTANVTAGMDPGIKITINGSDTVFHRNESGANQTSLAVNGSAYWNFTFSHDELADVPMDANENVTMDLTVYNVSNETGQASTIQFYLNNTGDRAVIYVGDDQTDEDVTTDTEAETVTESRAFGLLSERTSSTVEHDSLGIDGSTTTVYVVFANDTVATTYTDSLDRKWFGQSSYEAGDYVKFHQLYVEDNPHLVFNEEAPEAVTDNEDFTYGVFTEVDGQDAYEVTLGEEEYEDETSVDVVAHGNDAYGFIQNQQNRFANLMAGR